MTNPSDPEASAARSAYDAWHHGLDADAEADAPWHLLVRKHLEGISGARVLEIGCGRGGFAAWLATQGAREIVGADFSAVAVRKAVALARGRGLANVRFAVADLCALGCAEGAFDVVISCETIEHVADPARGVAELARVLRPGGRLYLTTPNYLGLMGIYRIYRTLSGRPYTEVGQPINTVTLLPRTCAWVYNAGLRIVVTDGAGHYLPWPRRQPIEFKRLDRHALRWTALHSLVVAEKPR